MDKYHDLHAQQGYARESLEQKQTQLAVDPINWQLKQEEDGYRDQYIKLLNYLYVIPYQTTMQCRLD